MFFKSSHTEELAQWHNKGSLQACQTFKEFSPQGSQPFSTKCPATTRGIAILPSSSSHLHIPYIILIEEFLWQLMSLF